MSDVNSFAISAITRSLKFVRLRFISFWMMSLTGTPVGTPFVVLVLVLVSCLLPVESRCCFASFPNSALSNVVLESIVLLFPVSSTVLFDVSVFFDVTGFSTSYSLLNTCICLCHSSNLTVKTPFTMSFALSGVTVSSKVLPPYLKRKLLSSTFGSSSPKIDLYKTGKTGANIFSNNPFSPVKRSLIFIFFFFFFVRFLCFVRFVRFACFLCFVRFACFLCFVRFACFVYGVNVFVVGMVVPVLGRFQQ